MKLYDVLANTSYHAPPLASGQMASFLPVNFSDEFLYGKKLKKTHKSRERPPAYIIIVASGSVYPISYCADIKKHAIEKDWL